MAVTINIAEALKPELDLLIKNIGNKNGYYGNKISPSIMRMFHVELRADGAGILVPYWIGVLQKGRGPRKSSKSSGLQKKIYAWMQRKGMFKSSTAKGKQNEARAMTWYINKYGNQHFRSKVFLDVYETETKKTIRRIDHKFSLLIGNVMSDVI